MRWEGLILAAQSVEGSGYLPVCPYGWIMSPAEKISSTDAKNQLNRLLTDVKAGTSYIITNHGEPVAQLIPIAAIPRRFGQLPNR